MSDKETNIKYSHSQRKEVFEEKYLISTQKIASNDIDYSSNPTDIEWEIKTDSSTYIAEDNPAKDIMGDYDFDFDIGPSAEEAEKITQTINRQLEKLRKLKEELIDAVAIEKLSRGESIQWKTDFEAVLDYISTLEKESESSDVFGIQTVDEDSVLSPSQLEKLNRIYKRWK